MTQQTFRKHIFIFFRHFIVAAQKPSIHRTTIFNQSEIKTCVKAYSKLHVPNALKNLNFSKKCNVKAIYKEVW